MTTLSTATRIPSVRRLTRAICVASIAAFCTGHAAIVTSSWSNATSGLWNVDANWTNVPALGAFPNNGNGGVATYDAVITATGSAYTVTLNTSVTVETLTLASANATLAHTAGTVAANTGLAISAGTYRLSGTGRISNTAIDLSGTGALTLAGGTIQGGTITGSSVAGLTVAAFSSATLNAVNVGTNVSVENSATLDVTNGLTLSNNARIALNSTAAQSRLQFGSGVQALGGTGEVVFGGTGTNTLRAIGGGSAATASALTIGSGITVRGTQSGTILAGFSFDSFLNQGTILADTFGATITLSGAWSNTGTLRARNGGTLALGGTFTLPAIGTFDSNGGTIAITGTLENVGNTLALTPTTGALTLRSGTIRGGTVTSSGGAGLLLAPSFGGTLDGVTLGTDVAVLNGTILNVNNGMTLTNNAKLTVASTAAQSILQLRTGVQTLAGTGEVVFAGSGGNNVLRAFGSGTVASTLTLGSGITVRGTQSGTIQSVLAIDSFINQGTVLADTVGETITLLGNWSNSGTLRAMNGGTLVLGGTFTLSAPGSFNSNGGTVAVTGILDNTGSILALAAATGPLTLRNGTIKGGTITSFDGRSLLVAPSSSGTLDGVSIASDLVVANNQMLSVTNDVHLINNVKITLESLGSSSTLHFDSGPHILDGVGEIVFGGTGGNNLIDARGTGFGSAASTLTIAQGITVRGTRSGEIAAAYPADSITNLGTILANAANETITLSGNWSALGTIKTANGGRVVFEGTLNNAGQTVDFPTDTGPLVLRGFGTIVGGAVTASGGGVPLEIADGQATLDGVNLGASVIVTDGTTLNVRHGLTLSDNAKITLNSVTGFSTLDFESGTQILGGVGEIVFGGSNGLNAIKASSGTAPSNLTIGPGITVRGTRSGTIGPRGVDDSIVNQGTFLADAAGQTITLDGNWTALGTIKTANGGRVVLHGHLNNANNTLDFPAGTGPLTMDAGGISGGTITSSGGGAHSTYKARSPGSTA